MLYTERKGKKNMNGKFLHDMLVNWCTSSAIRTLLFLWWAITVEPVLKETCIERSPVYKDHLKILLSKVHTCIFVACAVSKKIWYRNISDVKIGKAKKVQVTERLQGVKSLWGQEKKIYQQGCVELQHKKQGILFFKYIASTIDAS